MSECLLRFVFLSRGRFFFKSAPISAAGAFRQKVLPPEGRQRQRGHQPQEDMRGTEDGIDEAATKRPNDFVLQQGMSMRSL